MFTEHLPHASYLWHWVTRLGDVQFVLPLAALTTLMRVRHPHARPLTFRWAALLGLAMLVTLATKIAFIGWGVGSAELDFTGISGHAMFSAAVYPLLLSTMASDAPVVGRRFAIALGCAIAILVGVSRVILGAHSVAEVLAGWLVGGITSIWVLSRGAPAPFRTGAIPLLALGLWLVWMPAAAPEVDTHAIVTRLAMKLSGHQHPYTRSAMLREYRRRQGAPMLGARNQEISSTRSSRNG